MRRLQNITITVGLLTISASVHADVIYVDDSATGGDDGTSWIDAYIDLQDALAAAQPGDEIRLAQGIYKPSTAPNDASATFALVSGTILQGGYVGNNSPGGDPDALDPENHPTVLTGDLLGDDGPNFTNYGDNVLHLVTATESALGHRHRN